MSTVTKSWNAYVVRSNGDIYELPIAAATWEGQRWQGPRTLQLDVLATTKGLHKKTPVDKGDQVIFKVNAVEKFRGFVVTKTYSSDDRITLVVWDVVRYLCGNTTKENIKAKSLSELVIYLCKKFDVPMGKIATTSTKISRLFEGQTLYDIILTYINLEYKKTGQRYYLYADQGRINLVKRSDWLITWVIERGVNLISFERSEDISQLYTQVRLNAKLTTEIKKTVIEKGKKKEKKEKSTKEISSLVSAPDQIKRYGTLQYYENVSEDTNSAKLLAQAKQMLKEKGKMQETIEIEALGIPELQSGSVVYVVIPELAVKQAFYIDSDSHTFESGQHTMSLKLNRNDELPEMDASSKDESKDEKEKKAADKKKTPKKDKKKKGEDKFYENLVADIMS